MTSAVENKKPDESQAAAAAPLVVSGVYKSFGSQKVLDGVDLAVDRGQTVVVLGRSGTGKSVLLKLIVGLQQPDSGSIKVLGQEIAGLDMDHLNEIRKKLGFLFQQAALYDSLTVEENVDFPLSRHTTHSESDRKKKVRDLLASVGMEKDLNKMPSDISVECRSAWVWHALLRSIPRFYYSTSQHRGWIRSPPPKLES